MDFKAWFNLHELRYKGLWRKFRQENPDMPQAAAKDIYHNRPSYLMNKMMQGHQQAVAPTTAFHVNPRAPTTDWRPTGGVSITVDSSNMPTQILSNYSFKDYQWSPKPLVINVTPNDFSPKTLDMFFARRFGFVTDDHVRDDKNRMKKQAELMNMRGAGGNEPVIIIKGEDGKYELIEGWHRTMNYLVFDGDEGLGAPSDQIAILKNFQMPVNQIDLNRWKPVPIKAWVGEKRKQ